MNSNFFENPIKKMFHELIREIKILQSFSVRLSHSAINVIMFSICSEKIYSLEGLLIEFSWEIGKKNVSIVVVSFLFQDHFWYHR